MLAALFGDAFKFTEEVAHLNAPFIKWLIYRQRCGSSFFKAFSGNDRLNFDPLDLSKLSVEAFDEVLSRLLGLSDEYRPLLRRIAIRFLSATGVAIVAEHCAFSPEYVCCGILDHPLLLHSISMEKRFIFCGGAAAMDSVRAIFTAAVTGTRTH
jgi:hypothetical protein